ncbi:MAG: hypothetical protein ACI4EN_03380 [Butyrivibrio sp.]
MDENQQSFAKRVDGVRRVETMRTMLTQSLAVLMSFNVQELNNSGGNYYGI